MWEKCVGCGEGLFAGDAFCGNCGRPVTPAVPAAREPDGLESAPLAVPTAAPAADQVQVRIIPAGSDRANPEWADPDLTDSEQAGPGQAAPPEQAPGAVDSTALRNPAAPDHPERGGAQPHWSAGRRPDGDAARRIRPARNERRR